MKFVAPPALIRNKLVSKLFECEKTEKRETEKIVVSVSRQQSELSRYPLTLSLCLKKECTSLISGKWPKIEPQSAPTKRNYKVDLFD